MTAYLIVGAVLETPHYLMKQVFLTVFNTGKPRLPLKPDEGARKSRCSALLKSLWVAF